MSTLSERIGLNLAILLATSQDELHRDAGFCDEKPLPRVDEQGPCGCGCGHLIPIERLRPARRGGHDTRYASELCRRRAEKRRERERKRAA